MSFNAEKTNRAGDAKRVLLPTKRELRAVPATCIHAAPLSDEAIARCRAKARAARPR
jgi:hypothetical protein